MLFFSTRKVLYKSRSGSASGLPLTRTGTEPNENLELLRAELFYEKNIPKVFQFGWTGAASIVLQPSSVNKTKINIRQEVLIKSACLANLNFI